MTDKLKDLLDIFVYTGTLAAFFICSALIIMGLVYFLKKSV